MYNTTLFIKLIKHINSYEFESIKDLTYDLDWQYSTLNKYLTWLISRGMITKKKEGIKCTLKVTTKGTKFINLITEDDNIDNNKKSKKSKSTTKMGNNTTIDII